MNRLLFALLCPVLATACSAEVAAETDPVSTTVPVTSIFEPAYVEVAIDLPDGTQDVDVTVKDVNGTLTVTNPSNVFTLNASARLSLEGRATPDQPVFYTKNNLPPYYAASQELLAANFAPGTRTDVVIPNSATQVSAVRKPRIWLIVSNTISKASTIPGGALPVEVRIENAILRVIIGKEFRGLEGALGVGGL